MVTLNKKKQEQNFRFTNLVLAKYQSTLNILWGTLSTCDPCRYGEQLWFRIVRSQYPGVVSNRQAELVSLVDASLLGKLCI